MNVGVIFFSGFLQAGLVGLLSALILSNWQIIGKSSKRIFYDIPKPKIAGADVGTDINQSPIVLILEAILSIVSRLILEAGLIALWGALIWFIFQQSMTEDFMFGIVIAGIVGFFLQQIYKNWKKIGNLWKMIISPPTPSVSGASPPNNHYLNARPSLPAFSVVTNNSAEIVGRLIWVFTSFGILALTTIWVTNIYVLSLPVTRVFGT